MNLKKFGTYLDDLNNLYSKLNEPHGIIPNWTNTNLSANDIQSIENILDIKIPPEMRAASLVFSGVFHETPYFLENFQSLSNEIFKKSKNEITTEDFKNDLIISNVFSIDEWNSDELNELRAVHQEGMLDIESNKIIPLGLDLKTIKNEKFLLIGTSYSESIFINLVDEHDEFGSLYNGINLYPFYIVYKIANNYRNFLDIIEKSISMQINN